MKKRIYKMSMVVVLVLIMSLSLVACKSNDQEAGNSDASGEENSNQEEVIDKNTGLIYEGELELKYAENFKVDYYQDGYKIITDASNRQALIVPEGKDLPDMKEEMLVIQQPVETFGVYSTIEPAWFRPIDEIDRIVAVSFEEDVWEIDDMSNLAKSGKLNYVGGTEALDYEKLQAVNPSVHLLSKSHEEKLFPKFDELDLKYLSLGSYLEEDPRGRLEWSKFIGALLDKEDEAEEKFEEEMARIDEVEKKVIEKNETKPKLTMAYFSPSNQGFRVINDEGYKVKHIEMGGGEYFPTDLGDGERGVTGMTPEEFYKTISETDILIYDSVTGHSISDLDAMLKEADYLADTKVFQEGNVWALKREFWQAGDRVADITEEYYDILYSPKGEIDETEHFYLMK